jgi:hypothetical protein
VSLPGFGDNTHPEETMVKRAMACLGLAGVMLAALAAAPQARVDVTGKWAFNVETGAGGGQPTVTLKQDGEKLTGHYSSQTLGEADLTGSVKGGDISFSFNADAQGTALKVTYTGTIESKDAIKGKVDLGGMAEGTFTAKRQ